MTNLSRPPSIRAPWVDPGTGYLTRDAVLFIEQLVRRTGGAGDVTATFGPSSSTDNAVTRFNGTGGAVLQNSGVTIDDSDNIAGVGDLAVTGTVSVTGSITVTGTVDGRDLATDGAKLDGIESNADVTDFTNVSAALGAATGAVDFNSQNITGVGSITLSGTVDGRDVSTDGTKLDGIEANADVTDATNVAAAGAVMDADFSANGLMVRTSSGAYTSRSVAASTGISVSNSDGVSGDPTVSADLASQAEAEAGTDNTKVMTPLRSQQHFDAQAATLQYVDVYLNANQTPSADTWTKVEFDTEVSDADGVFDSTTDHRFTPTEAGTYLCVASVSVNAADTEVAGAAIAKNGSRVRLQTFRSRGGAAVVPAVTAFVEMNGSTDFIEVQGFSSDNATPRFNAGQTQTFFQARRVF